ncbi:MAG: Ti-type conjugative transfer relaxase TraA [Gammaproteobacteria bacterium 39-13]|nr:Ti-type conjugative transfer relaxase TraA [Gammaproteobacteria bacterium]OJV89739.1 MAG: Ti-type conjugative transfer relaxase TraA [Gammaproteobacteria bacterium 39-13]
MAIFHLDVKNISRSQGRSVVGAAAYRAGERIQDQRLGTEFDFTRKKGIAFSEILAPSNAPGWVKDRAQLWNAVESTEKRKDSRLAREIMIALPKELTQEERIALLKEFCQENFVNNGMIADINMHEDNLENPHAHILLTTREITNNGFGLKVREWNKRESVFEQRHSLQDLTNKHLFEAGHDTKIDCRSLQERGIDLEPGLHLGQAAYQEKGSEKELNFYRAVEHREILRANGERIKQNPTIALEKLTQQQSVFDEYALAKLANQYSADLNQYNEVLAALKSSEEVILLGKNDYGDSVYSTRKMITLEHQMLNHAYELNEKNDHKVDIDVANKVICDKSMTPSQQKAYSHIFNAGDMKIVTGLAGTGKSTLMGIVRETYEAAGYKVAGACLSGIAAQGLQEGSGISCATVDTRLLQWEKGRELLTAKDVLVIDEAGMLGTSKMEKLLSYANDAGAKVILVHDSEQLGAIDAGAPSRALAERFGEVALTDVMRQKSPEMRKATFEFGTGQTEMALTRYEEMGCIHTSAVDESIAQRMLIEAWSSERLETKKSQLILAYTNESVKSLNQMARQVRIEAGEIRSGEKFNVSKGERHFAKGDKIYFLKNDKSLNVKNGTLGTIEKISGDVFNVKIDGKEGRTVSFDIRQYIHCDHGYAATIHKAQGVTVDMAYVLASKHFDRHLTYVACTRHRENLSLFSHHQDFKNEEVLYKTLSRERSKSMAVDFAQVRNIESRNMHELGVNKHGVPQRQLANERLEIKKLNKQFPDKVFSFVRSFEHVKGMVQGIVNLSDNRQMLSVGKGNQSKLIAMSHDFENHLGKQVSIHFDKKGKIVNCSVEGQEKTRMASFDKVARGLDGVSQHICQRPLDDSLEQG